MEAHRCRKPGMYNTHNVGNNGHIVQEIFHIFWHLLSTDLDIILPDYSIRKYSITRDPQKHWMKVDSGPPLRLYCPEKLTPPSRCFSSSCCSAFMRVAIRIRLRCFCSNPLKQYPPLLPTADSLSLPGWSWTTYEHYAMHPRWTLAESVSSLRHHQVFQIHNSAPPPHTHHFVPFEEIVLVVTLRIKSFTCCTAH